MQVPLLKKMLVYNVSEYQRMAKTDGPFEKRNIGAMPRGLSERRRGFDENWCT